MARILKGVKAWRIAGHAADEIRVVINPKTAKDARHCRAAVGSKSRR
jgi:hypothetical protein